MTGLPSHLVVRIRGQHVKVVYSDKVLGEFRRQALASWFADPAGVIADDQVEWLSLRNSRTTFTRLGRPEAGPGVLVALGGGSGYLIPSRAAMKLREVL